MVFVRELLVVIGTICGLALIGGWAVVPLRGRGPHILYSAPAFGLMVVVVGVGTLYSTLRLPLTQSAAIVAVLGSIVTAAALWHDRNQLRPKLAFAPVVLGLALATAVTRLTCDTTLRFDSPGLLYFDGTDHLGYAQMADWLVRHNVLDPPRGDPSLPYESFPEVLFRVDTRFGSFEWMGIVSVLSRLPGSFAYDIACAIVISIGIMALVGLFTKTTPMAVCLSVCLLTSYWFDYASSGYFGKITGFPSSLFVAGLYVTSRNSYRLNELLILVIAVAAAGIMYSGLVTAFLVLVVGLTFAVYEALIVVRARGELGDTNKDRFIVLALLVGIATLTTGFASRPGNYAYPDYNLDWGYILPRVMDLDNQGVAVTGLDQAQVFALCGVCAAIVVAGVTAAALRSLSVPVALMGGPALLLGGLVAVNARAVAFQLMGTIYPLALCGLAVLIESSRRESTSKPGYPGGTWIAGVLLAVLALSHVPRFVGALERYAGPNAPEIVRFNLDEIETVSAIIGASTVEVDIAQPQAAIMALVEFGRRGMAVQWTQRSWATVLGYRPWPPPRYSSPAAFCLSTPSTAEAPTLYSSARYQLRDGPCGVHVP
jgi:hypothetical protein